MPTAPTTRWGIQVRWFAHGDWQLADGADRLARSLRAVAAAFPGRLDAMKPDRRGGPVAVDDPGLADLLVPVLRAKRNAGLFAGTELLGDAALAVMPEPYQGLSIAFSQIMTGSGGAESYLHVDARFGHGDLLVDEPGRLVPLIDELAVILAARNAWVDMVHVRQDWNRWHSDCPVYGWATWLHPDWATVDTTGLDLTDRTGSGGGRLLVLSVDPAAMADPDGTVGRDTIRELARRTVFADGTPLLDVNPHLREAVGS